MLEELPGIFLWAIAGLKRLRASGAFTIPKISQALAAEYSRYSSPVRAFVEDECVVGPEHRIETTSLYAAWQAWCDLTGHEAGTREMFGVRLRAAVPGLDVTRPRNDSGQRPREYVGIAIRRKPGQRRVAKRGGSTPRG